VEDNVPSNFFQCARKSIAFERHTFMPECVNFFFTEVTRDNNEISLDTRLMSLDLHPVSAFQAKVQGPAA